MPNDAIEKIKSVNLNDVFFEVVGSDPYSTVDAVCDGKGTASSGHTGASSASGKFSKSMQALEKDLTEILFEALQPKQ